MSTTDDKPPSDDDPPPDSPPDPDNLPKNLTRVIQKLSNTYELRDYVQHLAVYHAHDLTDEAIELKQRLLLQGLDDDDLYAIHEFLKITFDGDLMKIADRSMTENRAQKLGVFLT
jgi:hypothetical protein